MARLRKQQETFIREYLVDQNATRAAKVAGYAAASAHVAGCRLLRTATVRAEIDKGMAAVHAQSDAATEARRQRIRQELERVAYSDTGALYDAVGQLRPIRELPEDERRAVAGVETAGGLEDGPPLDDGAPRVGRPRTTKVKRWDKVKALELLAKMEGLLVDRQRHEGEGGGPLVVEVKTYKRDG